MIGRDPGWFLRETVRRWSGRAEPVAEEALREYGFNLGVGYMF